MENLEDDRDLYDMNGKDIHNTTTDYTDSLHYKINQTIKEQTQILSVSQKFGISNFPVTQVEYPIKFGKTKLSEYQNIAELGKGTYGVVNKCIHTPTGMCVAMKTFLFEVSKPTNINKFCRMSQTESITPRCERSHFSNS